VQGTVERPVGVDANVIGACAGQPLRDRRMMRPDELLVLPSQVIGPKRKTRPALGVLEGGRRREWEVALRGIYQVEDDDVVGAPAGRPSASGVS
jgi:hypothetical protein